MRGKNVFKVAIHWNSFRKFRPNNGVVDPSAHALSATHFHYKVFISYSHAVDDRLAPVLQAALHRCAKLGAESDGDRPVLRDRTTGPLFETARHTRYSPWRIQQLVQETVTLAGITKRVHPHLLRHSVATTLLERGMPLDQIQKFLGHAKLETT